MTDIIIIIVLLVILGLAAWYIRKEKKSGHKCIGCPHSGHCGKDNCYAACQCYHGAKKSDPS